MYLIYGSISLRKGSWVATVAISSEGGWELRGMVARKRVERRIRK